MNIEEIEFEVGQKIKFKSEKQRYTIQAAGKRFLVCTKPMNALKTVLYTIVDLKEKVRGIENLIFGMGFETRELCEEALDRLQKDESNVSHRNCISLDMEMVFNLPCRTGNKIIHVTK